MKTVHVVLITGLAVIVAASVPASGAQEASTMQSASVDRPSGGMLRTMPHGTYSCALPGDAGGAAFEVDDAETFRIFTASRYENAEGAGTYILRGRELTFTRGPKKGQMFQRVGDNQLRKLKADGSDTRMLCTRTGSR